MNKKQLSRCSRVVGYLPRGSNTFLLTESKVWPLSADVPGFFQANGVQIDLDSGDLSGSVSLWLTLPDAEALAAHLQGVIEEVNSWPEDAAPREVVN